MNEALINIDPENGPMHLTISNCTFHGGARISTAAKKEKKGRFKMFVSKAAHKKVVDALYSKENSLASLAQTYESLKREIENEKLKSSQPKYRIEALYNLEENADKFFLEEWSNSCGWGSPYYMYRAIYSSFSRKECEARQARLEGKTSKKKKK